MKRRAPTDALAVGVDLGGTHVLATIMDPDGKVHARHKVTLTAEMRGKQDTIGDALATCIIEAWRAAGSPEVRGVGVAVPGNVDPEKGLARYLPNFGWLEPVDLTSLVLDLKPSVASKSVRELLHIDRLHMRNDGRCAALAERHFGVGKSGEHRVMAMLTLGTGIGGALIHDPSPSRRGEIFDGSTFDAGDFGHHVMRSGADAYPCVCGNRGCFEQHASAAGLVRTYNKCQPVGVSPTSLDDAKTVVERMRSGDKVASDAFRTYRTDLASGLANLVTFYNPSLIVLGGGLARTPELYEGLEGDVDGSTLPATRGKCRIVQSALDADCAAMGAAWLVFAETASADGS